MQAKSMTSQRYRATYKMADMRYYGNVMTTTRWRLYVILHLQQYSRRLYLFFLESTKLTHKIRSWALIKRPSDSPRTGCHVANCYERDALSSAFDSRSSGSPSFVIFVKDGDSSGPGSVVGIATAYGLDGPEIESRCGEIFRTCPDRPWGPPSLMYNGYRVFPGGKVLLGRDADPSPPSSAEV